MNDSNKLFQKADALLGRYRGEPKATPEPDFPVLTEIVEPQPAPDISAAALSTPAEITFTETDLRELEARVVQQVSLSASSLFENVLPQSQREHIEELLRRALTELSEAARADMAERLTKLVSESVQTAILELRETRDPDEF